MILPKVLEKAIVVDNVSVGPDVKKLVLYSPNIVGQASPGQFVHVKIADSIDPLLRRPFGIAGVNFQKNTMAIYYRIVGRGTALLAGLQSKCSIDCLGPLGRGFDLDCERPLLIGGGMGNAPLLYLAQSLCPKPMTVLLGGRTKYDIFWSELFAKTCRSIKITTDDGSLGMKGTVIDALPELLEQGFDRVYTCGPKAMMRGVVQEIQKTGIPCQVSLEEHMACGLGACLSCTCASTGKTRKKVCMDGPVFWAEEILW